MLEYYNKILTVNYKDLVPKFYKTEGYLRKKISLDKKKGSGLSKAREGKGKNSHALIVFDSLPDYIKEQFHDPRKNAHILEQFYVTDGKAITFFTEYKFTDGTYIDGDIQEKYITNASVLRAVSLLKKEREYERSSKGYSTRGIFVSLTADAMSFNSHLNKEYGVKHNLPSSTHWFKDIYDKFEKQSYPALISKYHRNKSAQKATDITIRLLNNMFAGAEGKPSATEVARQYEGFLNGHVEVVSKKTGEVFLPSEYPKLSKNTITNYLKQWRNRIGTHAKRSGNRQVLLQNFSVYHSLDKPKFAGEIISIDDRQPPFKYSGNKRVWFYMGIDLGSEAWTTWVYDVSKEGLILKFYRQMVRNYHEWGFNLPNELEAESSLNSSFKNTFLQAGRMFQVVRIEANKARAKKVERYFGMLRYQKEKQREGWIARPKAISEKNQSKTDLAKVPLVPYNTIVENSYKDIEEWNNTEHADYEGKTRWDIFCEKQHSKLKPTNYKAILPYLGYKTQTSCKVGIVKLQGMERLLGDDGEIYFGERLIRLMELVEGRQLDIYWLDANDGTVIKALVYLRGETQLICELLPKPTYSRSKIGRTPENNANRELMSKYANTIDGFMKKRKNEIENLLIKDEIPVTLNDNFKIKMPDFSGTDAIDKVAQEIASQGFKEEDEYQEEQEPQEKELATADVYDDEFTRF